jgi:thiol-disulfide isomerase/thioredoxin
MILAIVAGVLGVLGVLGLIVASIGFIGYRAVAIAPAPAQMQAQAMPPAAPPIDAPAGGMGMPAVPGAAGMAGAPPGGGPMVAMPPAAPKIGDVAPEIEGQALDGQPLKLSDFRGKVVALDFWGNWCPPCRAAYPFQNNLISRLKDEPFVLLGVNCDQTKQEAQTALNRQKLGLRAWYDIGGPAMNGPIYQRYGVRAVPTTFVIDKNGVLRQRIEGAMEILIDNAIDQALALGEKRAPDAPQRWQPGSTALAQLGQEVEAGKYRLRLPQDFAPEKPAREGDRQTYRWKGPARPDGTSPVLEVTMSPAQPAEKTLERVLEKDIQAISHPALGWNCGAPERGEVKGVTFARARWSILESPVKYKAGGCLYAAVDGDALIRISIRDSLATLGTALESAPLTFRKAPLK